MNRVSWVRRLRALEARPSAKKPLAITGGLPTGAQMIAAAAQVREPRCAELAERADPGPEPAKESTRAKDHV
jgi:hypothetical protein